MRCLAITSVRNEGAFLLEWVAHARALGFTDFLVFSNDCEDGTGEMLDRLAAFGWLVHVPQTGPFREGPQWAALKQADRHPLKAAADWVMVLDVDEFPVVHAGAGGLADLFAALPDADAIPLTWRLFGNDRIVSFTDSPVTEQFTRAAPRRLLWPWRAQMVKTLFRNDGRYRKLGVHRPRGLTAGAPSPRWRDGSGRALPAPFLRNRLFSILGEDNYQIAQLNHYPLGSMESYIVKCDRGRANRGAAPFDMSYWVERNFCDEEDRTIRRYDTRSGAIRAELMADPVLSGLHARAVAWRKARFDELLLREEYRALFGRLLLTPRSEPLGPEDEARMIALERRAHEAKHETIR